MGDWRFFSLGSGSSGNCYYIGTSHYGILLDAGLSLRRIQKRLKDVNIKFENIYGILLTHGHADHVRGANAISNNLHIPFYATQETFNLISTGYRSQYIVDKADQRIIKTFNPFSIGEFNIQAFPLDHDVPNVGYEIEFRGKKIVLATDLGCTTEYLNELVSKTDYLILESNYDDDMLIHGSYPYLLKQRILGNNGHLSNKKASDLIKEHASVNLKKLFLCHLSAHNNSPELAAENMKANLPQNTQLVVLPRLEPTLMIEL